MVFPFLGGGRRCWCLHVFLFFGLAGFLVLLPACSGPTFPSRAPTPTPLAASALHLVTSHVLTVGNYTNYFPQEFVDPFTRVPAGFDIDLINAIGRKMHLQVRVVSTDFSSLIEDLQARHFDVVISAVSITPELQKKVNFVSYFRGGKSFLVAQGNPFQVRGLNDLCGKKVAAMALTFEQRELLSIGDSCLRADKPSVSVTVLKQYSDAVALLQSHQVAAAYVDTPVADYYVQQYPKSLALGGAVVDSTMEGIAVRKNDTLMLSTLQLTLHSLQTDGTYHALIVKWGLSHGDNTVPAHYDASVSSAAPLLWQQ